MGAPAAWDKKENVIALGAMEEYNPAVRRPAGDGDDPPLRLPHMGVPGEQPRLVALQQGERLRLLHPQGVVPRGGARHKGDGQGGKEEYYVHQTIVIGDK